jgi:hypothetical protein
LLTESESLFHASKKKERQDQNNNKKEKKWLTDFPRVTARNEPIFAGEKTLVW